MIAVARERRKSKFKGARGYDAAAATTAKAKSRSLGRLGMTMIASAKVRGGGMHDRYIYTERATECYGPRERTETM